MEITAHTTPMGNMPPHGEHTTSMENPSPLWNTSHPYGVHPTPMGNTPPLWLVAQGLLGVRSGGLGGNCCCWNPDVELRGEG